MGDSINVLSAEDYFQKYAENGIGKGADRWMIKRQLIGAFKKEIYDLIKLRTGKELKDLSVEELPEASKKAKSIIHDSAMKWKKLCRMFEGYEQTQNLLKVDDLKIYDEIEDQGITAEEANEQANGFNMHEGEVAVDGYSAKVEKEDGEEGYAKLLDQINTLLIIGKSDEEIAKELNMSEESVRQIRIGISIGKMVEAGLSIEEIAMSCDISEDEVKEIINTIAPIQTSGYVAVVEEPTEEEIQEYLENLPEPQDLNLEEEASMVQDDLIEGVVQVSEKIEDPQAFINYAKSCHEKGMKETEIAASLGVAVSSYRRMLSESMDILRERR